jgi:hypothetical protein
MMSGLFILVNPLQLLKLALQPPVIEMAIPLFTVKFSNASEASSIMFSPLVANKYASAREA